MVSLVFFYILQLPHIVISNSEKLTHLNVQCTYGSKAVLEPEPPWMDSSGLSSSNDRSFCNNFPRNTVGSLTGVAKIWAPGAGLQHHCSESHEYMKFSKLMSTCISHIFQVKIKRTKFN